TGAQNRRPAGGTFISSSQCIEDGRTGRRFRSRPSQFRSVDCNRNYPEPPCNCSPGAYNVCWYQPLRNPFKARATGLGRQPRQIQFVIKPLFVYPARSAGSTKSQPTPAGGG